ncbi:hypothetical protein C1145_07350 [Clostridium botulinum]|nr:hypothetical protein C1145_07350 [Clostridium botulinum]
MGVKTPSEAKNSVYNIIHYFKYYKQIYNIKTKHFIRFIEAQYFKIRAFHFILEVLQNIFK